MIKLKDLIIERIESDVEKAGKKAGIKFKKISHDITTNKFSNPEGDISKAGKDNERVRMNSWIADEGGGTGLTKQNYKEAGDKIIKILKRRYKLVKLHKYANSVVGIFFKDKKNPRTEFRITYAKTTAGPYIGYDGVKGQ